MMNEFFSDAFEDCESIIEIEVPAEDAGKRIDLFLSESTEFSRSRIASLADGGMLFVNKCAVKRSYKLSENDCITLICPPPEDIDPEPEDIPLDIVYEDNDLLVVNKAQGMVTHPAPGNYSGTLVNALLWHCKDSLSGINGKKRPGIVHRIDKNTSGLLIVAKNDKSHLSLASQIKEHSFSRKYEALVYGHLPDMSNRIETAIGRSRCDRKKMAAYPINTPNTKNAITEYKVEREFDKHSLVELTLFTGRTHQIRVHMSHIGHPVVADDLYAKGLPSYGLPGQCLHAKHIGFIHPTTGKHLEFNTSLPEYFENTIRKIQ